MKAAKTALLILFLLLPAFSGGPAFSADREKEFIAIGKMSPRQLASRAKATLGRKFPGEDWEKYKFPKYVYIQDAVQIAYKIAVKNPGLLAKFACYCFCEPMGHKNLAYCFLVNGTAGGNFDDHASTCNICVNQAMTAFLWDDLGVPEAEMKKAMKETFDK